MDSASPKSATDIRASLKLRPVINVSGTMTSLGASIVVPEAVEAVSAVLTEFVEMGELYRRASDAIAELTGAEAGFVTASCSAGITLAVAACMTGPNLAAIERLPDTRGLKNEVLIQSGHMVSYGAPVEQAIVPDPTNNPLDRLKVAVDAQAANITAWDLADRLAAGDPPVIVRDHEVEHGYFFLDPCNLHADEELAVAKRLAEELDAARRSNWVIATPFVERLLAREAAILKWPG